MNKISAETNIEELESVLASDSPGIAIDFVTSNQYLPGVFAFFVQVVCSKLRSNSNLEIATNISSEKENDIVENYHRFYHLLTMLLFKVNAQITDKNGFLLKRDVLYSKSIQQFQIQEDFYSKEFTESSNILDTSKSKVEQLRKRVFSDRGTEKVTEGINFFIPCFDHISAMSSSAYFYNNNGMLRDKEEVASWVSQLFKYNNLNLRVAIERNNFHQHLAEVIKELFDNTNEWATKSFDHHKYSPNLRACHVSIYMEGRLERLASINGGESCNYISQILGADPNDLIVPNWQGEILTDVKKGVCELSILDTGPGLARRWLSRDYDQITMEDETKAVVQCFNKYATSDVSGRSKVRGRGLNSVIKIIGRNGFLFVRTGRHSYERNFFSLPLASAELAEPGISFLTQKRSLVEGTSITILLPFVYSV